MRRAITELSFLAALARCGATFYDDPALCEVTRRGANENWVARYFGGDALYVTQECGTEDWML